jgi:phospholipase C
MTLDIATLREKIDTIAIVMLENRSFDHLLGYLSHEDFGKRSEVDGLHQNSSHFEWGNPDLSGHQYPPMPVVDGWLPHDPPHGRKSIRTEIGDNGSMLGFVQAYQRRHPRDQSPLPPPMGFLRPEDVPVTAALAEHYCVCDRWFSSLPADTQTNRNMAVSGYTLIDTTNVIPVLKWLPNQTTILDWLAQKRLPFDIYVDAPFIVGAGRPSNFLLMPSQWQHLQDNTYALNELGARWRGPGKAPAVIYCEPYYDTAAKPLGGHGNCNHPPLPVTFGEEFLSRVYRALTSNADRWERTILIVYYDEHGGFFDHVKPPRYDYPPPPHAVWKDREPFHTLGIRVPALVISPYAAKRSVCHETLDHSSLLQLVVERFGAAGDLTFFGDAARRKEEGNVSSVLTALSNDKRADIIPLPTPILRRNTQPPARAHVAQTPEEHLFADSIDAKVTAGGGQPV